MVSGEGKAGRPWLAPTSGEARRTVVLAAAAGSLLLSGAAAARALLYARAVPPWVEVAVFGAAAAFALAGMTTLARTLGGPGGRAEAAAPPPPAGPPPLQRDEAETPDPPSTHAPLEHFQVETRTGRLVIPAAELEWIEASGNYVTLHLPGKGFLYRRPLVRLERELDDRFLRVHRSAIVNVTAIHRFEQLPSGDADLWLASGARVRLSRRYASAFHQRTGRAH